MSLSLYNKYRPQTFADVVGQEHVEKTLANAVATTSFSHAYLFTGPRGTGKTTTARLLAKALLCEQAPTPTPDGTCSQCVQISEGLHPDVYELDAASRTGVDNVRDEIINRVQFAPTHGNYKVYIIDEVHMLSTAAFNALLKTLEEPPPHVVFVLCTTDVQKVPKTVTSRCQQFDFHRLGVEQIAGRLRYICEQEGFSFEDRALELIAGRSAGGMRDAIGALEQVAVFGGGEVSYLAAESMLGEVSDVQLTALATMVASRDAAGCFEWVSGFIQSGSDIATLTSDFAIHIRNLYVVAVAGSNDQRLAAVLNVDSAAIASYREQAAGFGSVDHLAFALTTLGDLSSELKDTANARLALEIALTKMVRPQSSLTLEALAARLAVLETGGQAGQSIPCPNIQQPSGLDNPDSKAEQTNSGALTEPNVAVESKFRDEKSSANVKQPVALDSASVSNSNSNSEQAQIAQSDYQMWDQVVDRIKAQSLLLASNLGGSQPHLDAGGCLTIELPPKSGLSKSILEEPDNHKLITDTVQSVSKKPLTVRYVLGDEPIPACTPDLEIDATLLDEEATNPAFEPEAEPVPAPEPEPEPKLKLEPKPEQARDLEIAPKSLAGPAAEPESAAEPAEKPEPSKEDLESIISASVNSTIRFEEV